MRELFEVLADDEEFLVVNKPAGLVCHPTKGDEYSSLISRARLYLGEGERPHLVNRLDRETSGVVLIAKSSEAAAALRKLWESREIEKEYEAIVHGHPAAESFIVDAPLGADVRSEVAIKDAVVEGGAVSKTLFFVRRRFEREGRRFAFLRVLPVTGRKHQIRIHLSHAGYPIIGDKLYGASEHLYLAFVKRELTDGDRQELILPNHALHAGRLSFQWKGARRTYACRPEIPFRRFVEGKELPPLDESSFNASH